MNAPVTRRALLGATAAVGACACALPAIAEAGIAVSNPDAELLGFIARHGEADAALRDAEDEVDRLILIAAAEYPPQPETLVWRPGDFPRTSYGTGAADEADHDGRRRYRERGVEWLRRLTPPAVWTDAHEARRREIVEAWEGWLAVCDAVDRRIGVQAAEARRVLAGAAFWSLDEAIRAREARTLHGLTRKATWIAERSAGSGLDETDGLAAFAREVAAFGGAAS